MTKVRSLWPRRRGGKKAVVGPDGPAHSPRISPTTPADCLRVCARYTGEAAAGGDRKRTELVARLARLAQLAAAGPPDGGAAAGIADELFEALIAAGNKAVECGGADELKLALVIADTALTERNSSRAGWRLRARALEAAGDEGAAVEAYERYLELTSDDSFSIASRVAGLRIAQNRQQDMLRLLARECPDAERFAGRPADQSWAEGLELRSRGDLERARPRLVGALLALGRDGAPVLDLQKQAGEYLGLRIADAGGDASELRELIGLYAEQRRNRMRPPLLDPTVGGVDWIGLGELRNLIAGKSVCLVANSSSLARSSLGAEIDAYDLVVRFSSYLIDAPATGTRTDLHATSYDHGFNWDQRVTTRLVFGGESDKWRYVLRERLVPGAQAYVGDESIRWPVRHIGEMHWDAWPSVPTSGFNTLWLLDFLDVSPTLDLLGFDFYTSGVHRLPGAMNIPVTSEREYTSEKTWVMERAQSINDLRISLR
jgi:tetratricopeptide (TPR) repeat protein